MTSDEGSRLLLTRSPSCYGTWLVVPETHLVSLGQLLDVLTTARCWGDVRVDDQAATWLRGCVTSIAEATWLTRGDAGPFDQRAELAALGLDSHDDDPFDLAALLALGRATSPLDGVEQWCNDWAREIGGQRLLDLLAEITDEVGATSSDVLTDALTVMGYEVIIAPTALGFLTMTVDHR